MILALCIVGAVIAYFIFTGLLAVAACSNKRFPDNANISEWLWVVLVVLLLPAFAIVMIF